MFIEYYVVFEPAKKRWWNKFLHPRFMHCYIIHPDNGRWLVQNKTCSDFEVFTIDCASAIISRSIVVKAKRIGKTTRLIKPNSCVEYVKAVLGINKPLILTPYQLYKHLRCNHGK